MFNRDTFVLQIGKRYPVCASFRFCNKQTNKQQTRRHIHLVPCQGIVAADRMFGRAGWCFLDWAKADVQDPSRDEMKKHKTYFQSNVGRRIWLRNCKARQDICVFECWRVSLLTDLCFHCLQDSRSLSQSNSDGWFLDLMLTLRHP